MAKRTYLNDWHRRAGAKMTEFAGWEMPLYYSSILQEHRAVRSAAGLFDLNHMGRLKIHGEDRYRFLDYMTSNDVQGMEVGQVRYSLLCNKQGGIIDDITVYCEEDSLMLVVNAINREVVLSWLNQHREDFSVEVEDASETLGMTALQGPLAGEILHEVAQGEVNEIRFYHFADVEIGQTPVLVSRTGYTGEDGFEIYLNGMYTMKVWEVLLEAGREKGLVPAGLGARDSLRIEACMPLYGHELNPFTTPFEAGLTRFVKMEKEDFIGKTALVHSTTTEFARSLVAFVLDARAIPRPQNQIYVQETPIGSVTSGTFSPVLSRGIGMGYVDQYKASEGTAIDVNISERLYKGEIVKRPIYSRRSKK